MLFTTKTKLYIIVLIYVDDIIIMKDDLDNITKLKHKMMNTFYITKLKDAMIYLKVELHYDKIEIHFHQKQYIDRLLERFNCTSYKLSKVPMNLKTKLQRETRTRAIVFTMYQSLVGHNTYVSQ